LSVLLAQFCSKVTVFTWIVYRSLAALMLAQVIAWRPSISGLRAAPPVLRVQAVGQQNDPLNGTIET
jgi:Na+/phosphate symporter